MHIFATDNLKKMRGSDEDGPVQTLGHEITYILLFLFMIYKVYQVNSDPDVELGYVVLYIIIIAMAIISHFVRIYHGFDNLVKYSKKNMKRTMIEISKNVIAFLLLYYGEFNMQLVIFGGILLAFADLYFYNRAYESGVFSKFITYHDPYITVLAIIVLLATIKYTEVRYPILYAVVYDITFHIIEYMYVNNYIRDDVQEVKAKMDRFLPIKVENYNEYAFE